MIQLAILDDDKTHLQMMAQALQGGEDAWVSQLQVSFFDNVPALMAALQANDFDCVILDRQVGEASGDDVLRWIRGHCPPQTVVVMVTNLAGAAEVSALLALGADDYVTKPYQGLELLARVRRLLGKQQGAASPAQAPHHDAFGFAFDRARLLVTLPSGASVLCTEREFTLALFLFQHVGQPLSRAEIFENVWQRSAVNSSRAVDAMMHRVRVKLQLEPKHAWVLRPIYGFGYRLDRADAAEGV